MGGRIRQGAHGGQGFSASLCRFLYSFSMRPREDLSVTAASARGVARLVADAAHGIEVVVTRHHKPVAAVVGVERLRRARRASPTTCRDLALGDRPHRRRQRPTHRSLRRSPAAFG